MPDELPQSMLEQIAERLIAHGVRFLVVGGQAEWLFGSPRATFDVDLCYSRDNENLARLAAALLDFNVKLRGAPPDLPFVIDKRTLAHGCNFTFSTALGDLDLLGYVEPLGGYEQLASNAETYQIGTLRIQTIGLDDLIRVKQHIKRPKDQESLSQLRAIRQVRSEQ